MSKSHGTGRRLRYGIAAALGAAALAALGTAGGAAADPPATAPGIVAVHGIWGVDLQSAQDRPDCLGRYAALESPQTFDTFVESKETYSGGWSSTDPRFGVDNPVMFYLHVLRDTSTTLGQENAAYDGTYAVFDDNGLAIAQGNLQGVGKNGGAFATTELMNGVLYGGQVLRPSGATIGLPHLVANFESEFGLTNNQHTANEGAFGGTDFNYQRPAVVAQGACPGAYTKRPVVVSNTATRSAHPQSAATVAREAAYVQRLYEMTRGR
jgi:hypothetical protein